MNDIITKLGNRNDVAPEVLLLENGLRNQASRDTLRRVVDRAAGRGLNIEVKTLEEQEVDVESGIFPPVDNQPSRRRSIALARTMLQHYLFLKAKPKQGSVVWILDDDVMLEGLGYGDEGSLEAVDVDYVSAIKRLKKADACVVLGEVVGDPPLPSLSCIRTQLVDLYHNLEQMAALGPKTPYPDRSEENRIARLSRRDYYYDLSRAESDHLESPFWYEASEKDQPVGWVFDEMVSRLPAMLGGSQVFRPLVQAVRNKPLARLVPISQQGAIHLGIRPPGAAGLSQRCPHNRRLGYQAQRHGLEPPQQVRRRLQDSAGSPTGPPG